MLVVLLVIMVEAAVAAALVLLVETQLHSLLVLVVLVGMEFRFQLHLEILWSHHLDQLQFLHH